MQFSGLRASRHLPIRSRLLLYLGLCLVPAAVLLVLQARSDEARVRTESEHDSVDVVERLDALFQRELSAAVATGHALLVMDLDAPGARARCNEAVAAMVGVTGRAITNYALTDDQGRILCTAVKAPTGVQLGDRPYFRQAVATGQASVSGLNTGRFSGRPSVQVAVPRRDARGRVDRVAVISLSAGSLGMAAASPAVVALAFDRDGRVVSANPSNDIRRTGTDARSSGLWTAIEAGARTGEAQGVDGRLRQFVARPVEFNGRTAFWLAGDVELADLEVGRFRTRWLHFAAAVLAAFATALIAGVGIRTLLLGRVQHLRAAASRVASGGSHARIPLEVEDELTPVEAAFNEMLDAVQRQLEAARASEARYRHLFESSLDGVIDSVPGGAVIEANAAAHQLLGYAPGELVGLTQAALVPADEAQRVGALLATRSAAGAVRGELSMVRKDGTRVELELWSTLYRTPDGQQRNWMLLHDISERRRDEARIRELNAQLERRVRQRTEALHQANVELQQANGELEAFTYSVSHDLRSPANVVTSYAQYLREHDAVQEPRQQHYLARIEASGRRMSELIDALLALAQVSRAPMRRQRVDLSALAESVAADLLEANADHPVRVHVAPGLLAAGDPVLLRNALGNLLSNAWKFTRGRPAPEITVTGHVDEEGQCEIVVRDNGAGFDGAQAQRLFRPFQRLHRQDEFPGIGIGLATVHRIVERHGGTIHVEAAPGQGAAFRLRIPTKV